MQKQMFAYVFSSVYLHGGASGRAVGLTMVKVVLLILPGRTAQAEKGRGWTNKNENQPNQFPDQMPLPVHLCCWLKNEISKNVFWYIMNIGYCEIG